MAGTAQTRTAVQTKPGSRGEEAEDAMSVVRVRRVALHVLVFVAVIVAMSTVGIWLDLGPVVE